MKKLCLAWVLMLWGILPLQAQYNYYVATTGSNSNSGTSPSPFATVQYAIDEVISVSATTSGTYTVHIGDGVYNENLKVRYIPAGLTEFNIQPTNTTNPSVEINGGGNNPCMLFKEAGQDRVHVKNLILKDGAGKFMDATNVSQIPNSSSYFIYSQYGGGVLCWEESSPSFENCTIVSCVADHGGGVAAIEENSDPKFTNCTISDNYARILGGGFYLHRSFPEIKKCIISGNLSDDEGGGFYSERNAGPHVENCLITGNVTYNAGTASGNAGAIATRHGSTTLPAPTFDYCTISGNYSSTGSIVRAYTGRLYLNGCIVWGNSPSGIGAVTGATLTATYSDIEGGYTGTGNFDADPKFRIPITASSTPSTAGDFHIDQAPSPTLPPPPVVRSPCLGRVETPDVAEDIEGNVRDYQNTLSDCGAYESPVCVALDASLNFITVDANSPASNCDADGSADRPYRTIQGAIDVASSGDRIKVLPGTYYENIDFNNKDVTVHSTAWAPTDNPGDALQNQLSAINSTLIYGVSSTDPAAVVNNASAKLIGFKISNGEASGVALYDGAVHDCVIANNDAVVCGGGVFIQDGKLSHSLVENNTSADGGGVCMSGGEIEEVEIYDNTANDDGGGLYVFATSLPSIDNLDIHDNTATDAGGGIYLKDITQSGTVIDNDEFSVVGQNEAAFGAGVAFENCELTWENTVIDQNTASSGGGAFFLDDAEITLANMTISQSTNSSSGTAFYAENGSVLNFSGMTFSNNGAYQDGGVIYLDGSTLNATDCSFANNVAYNHGGAIYAGSSSTVNIDNSDFDQNYTFGGDGGAIYGASADINLSSTTSGQVCDFTNNSATSKGGAIGLNLGSITATNTIVKDNSCSNKGGGFWIKNNAVSLIDGVTFESNESGGSGGGLAANLNSATFTIKACTFIENEADTKGGGLHVANTTLGLVLEDNTFKDNIANNGGGIAWVSASGNTMTDCVIDDEFAFNDGAGMYLEDAEVEMENTDILNCLASNYGGAIYMTSSSELIMKKAELIFNRGNVNSKGGGIYAESSTLDLENVLMQNNRSDQGNAMYIDGSSVNLVHVTVVKGGCATCEGAIYITDAASVVKVMNSILWDFPFVDPFFIDPSGTAPTLEIEYSDVLGGGTGGLNSTSNVNLTTNSVINLDPQFADPNPTSGLELDRDFRLTPGSPCLSAGIDKWTWNSVVRDHPDEDLDEIDRPLPLLTYPDQGAYEHGDGDNGPEPLISGVKYHDKNGNGVRDPGEPVMSGWKFEYRYIDDNGDPVVGLLITDENGRFVIPNALIGKEYTIYEYLPVLQDDPEIVVYSDGYWKIVTVPAPITLTTSQRQVWNADFGNQWVSIIHNQPPPEEEFVNTNEDFSWTFNLDMIEDEVTTAYWFELEYDPTYLTFNGQVSVPGYEVITEEVQPGILNIAFHGGPLVPVGTGVEIGFTAGTTEGSSMLRFNYEDQTLNFDLHEVTIIDLVAAPNPSNGIFNLLLQDVTGITQIQITSINTGTVVYTNNSFPGGGELPIDIQGQAPGAYSIEVQCANGTLNETIIIQ